MKNTRPRFKSYVVVNAHTGHVHSTHDTRALAKSAKDAAKNHALRVRGGEPSGLSVWERIASILSGQRR